MRRRATCARIRRATRCGTSGNTCAGWTSGLATGSTVCKRGPRRPTSCWSMGRGTCWSCSGSVDCPCTWPAPQSMHQLLLTPQLVRFRVLGTAQAV
jgi:hypothetical protein